MAEKMLYVLAGYDDSTQEYLAGIQQQLYAQGFCGTHTLSLSGKRSITAASPGMIVPTKSPSNW